MTTITSSNPLAGTSGTSTSTSSSTTSDGVQTASAQSDRFLTLLVAQMKNQDPLNPMDSAQVTSQMAQISTVEGVQKLNTTVSGLNSQFLQLQTMQGAALVGHDVAIDGNSVRENSSTHLGDGGFELTQAATSVKVDMLNAAGQSVGSVDLGAQDAGRHSFSATVPSAWQGQPLTFKVTAMADKASVDAAALTYSRISAVSTANNQLSLELANGKQVAYDAVAAFL